MEENKATIELIEKILSDTTIWIAIVGFLGVLAGALITALSTFGIEWWKQRPKKELDSKRKALLIQMLEDKKWPNKWRYISTLSAVIGANEDETKRLLIEVEARGHEKNDGRWGLIKHHALNETKE
jgi:hypothetical protein